MAVENRGPELAAIVSVYLGLSAVTVALRCYTRICLLKIFRIEDWFAVLALLSSVAFTYFVLVSVEYGAGEHTANVPSQNIPKVLQMRWAGEITYVITSMLLKLTISIFLLRICSRMWHRALIWGVVASSLVFNFFYVFVAAFQCKPVSYFWDQYTTDMDGSCLSAHLIESSTYAAVGVNAFADWTLGLLPIAIVWHLDLKTKSKISIAGILALGSIASTATIVRIFYIYQLEQSGDLLWTFTDLAIWSTVENGLGLTASSVATLRPFFRAIMDPDATPSTAIKRASNGLKFHCRGPSADVNDGDSYYRMGPYPPPGTAKARYYRQSDSSTISSPTFRRKMEHKHSWQSDSSYGSSTHSEHSLRSSLHRENTGGENPGNRYIPQRGATKTVRNGWHSDGTRRYYEIGDRRISEEDEDVERGVPRRPPRAYSHPPGGSK